MALTDEAFDEIGEDRWIRACNHVETVIDEMKAMDLYTGQKAQHFVIHVTGSSDEGTDTADDDSSTDTASEAEEFQMT